MPNLALSNKMPDSIADLALMGAGAMAALAIVIFSIGPRPPPSQAVAREAKSDHLPKDFGPRTVKIERFMPPPREIDVMPTSRPEPDASLWWPPQPMTKVAGWPKEQAKAKPAEPPRDVCAKYGKRKVFIDGGKRWRCRK